MLPTAWFYVLFSLQILDAIVNLPREYSTRTPAAFLQLCIQNLAQNVVLYFTFFNFTSIRANVG